MPPLHAKPLKISMKKHTNGAIDNASDRQKYLNLFLPFMNDDF